MELAMPNQQDLLLLTLLDFTNRKKLLINDFNGRWRVGIQFPKYWARKLIMIPELVDDNANFLPAK